MVYPSSYLLLNSDPVLAWTVQERAINAAELVISAIEGKLNKAHRGHSYQVGQLINHWLQAAYLTAYLL
jgi:hypothetical protein